VDAANHFPDLISPPVGSRARRWLAHVAHEVGVALSVAVAAAVLQASPASAADGSEDLVSREVAGTYADVKAQVIFAIEERGLNVTGVAEIGQMLERTGKDFGVATTVYGDAAVIQFCSARLSHAASAEDPRAVALCPISIAVYSLPARPDRVSIVYRRMRVTGIGEAFAEQLRKAEALVEEIVAGAAE
jgi:uncharacterized protein (DUF302 family)